MTLGTKAALASLSTGGKRERVNDAQMVTKLPSAVKQLVSDVARNREVSEAVIVREALGEYLHRRGYRG